MTENRGRESGDSRKPTPEEVDAFEERIDTIGGFQRLAEDDFAGSVEQREEEIAEARSRGASQGEIRKIVRRWKPRLQRLTGLSILLIATMILLMALFYGSGVDLSGGIASRGDSQIERIAPPEPAATPAEILPPEVFPLVCDDCGDEVVQVPLDLNPAAKHQFGYDAGGSRLGIFTILEGSEYEGMVEGMEDYYQKAIAEGQDVGEPKYLDDVGDGAVVHDMVVVFKSGDDCGMISANMLQDVEGNPFETISREELEKLARIAAPRM